MAHLPVREVAARASRRDQILDAAESAFAARGFRGSTLATVAEQIGLTQQGVLHYFASKNHLLLAVLERRQDTDVSSFWAFDGSYLDALIRLVHANEARPGIIALFVTLSAESTEPGNVGHAWWKDRYETMRALVAEALSRDQAAGVVAADIDVAAVAIQIIALMDGLQLQWLLAPDSVDMAAVLTSFLATLRTRS